MLPFNLDDLIPKNHMVKVEDAAIDKINPNTI